MTSVPRLIQVSLSLPVTFCGATVTCYVTLKWAALVSFERHRGSILGPNIGSPGLFSSWLSSLPGRWLRSISDYVITTSLIGLSSSLFSNGTVSRCRARVDSPTPLLPSKAWCNNSGGGWNEECKQKMKLCLMWGFFCTENFCCDLLCGLHVDLQADTDA